MMLHSLQETITCFEIASFKSPNAKQSIKNTLGYLGEIYLN